MNDLDRQRLRLESTKEVYMDGAYVLAGRLNEAKNQSCELIGPAQPSAHRARARWIRYRWFPKGNLITIGCLLANRGLVS
jgi:hypothetical protein